MKLLPLKITTGFLLLFYCFFSSAQKTKSFKNINWLTGRWEAEGKKGNTYEEWKLIDDQKMEGRSYRVYRNDTTFMGTMQLAMEGSEVYYVATMKDQNSGEPVRFKLTDGNAMHMKFENSEQDYPRTIKYQWKQNNRFNIEVGGLIKGKMKTQVYIYKKLM